MGGSFDAAVGAVGWLGAVQSQDYPLAKWSLGKRVAGLVDNDMDKLLATGEILRTHILRPTWHFVLPADIRWMMELTAPRIWTRNQPPGLFWPEAAVIGRGLDVIGAALAGGNRLTRKQLVRLIVDHGVVATRTGNDPDVHGGRARAASSSPVDWPARPIRMPLSTRSSRRRPPPLTVNGR